MSIIEDMITAAEADLETAELLFTVFLDDDDIRLGIAGYHIQQLAEKSLKAVLEFEGIDYRSIKHRVDKAFNMVRNQVPNCLSTRSREFLAMYGPVLNTWESEGRYPSGALFMLNTLKQMFVGAKQVYVDCYKWVTTIDRGAVGPLKL